MRALIVILISTLALGFSQQAPPTEKVVDVTLREWKIEMPASLTPGTYILKVINKGDHSHTLKIKNDMLDKKLPKELKAGETGELKVDLRPGTYKVTCPIGFSPLGHASKGMSMKLVVAPIS
jgi:uncharacterized cupredoxin-like copper-binding protein